MERSKKIEYAKIALALIGAAGVVAVASVAPGMLLAAQPFIGKRRDYYPKPVINRTLQMLRAHGLIELVRQGGFYSITPKGAEILARYQLKERSITRPKRWDKRWRVVMFDVKEPLKKFRDDIRRSLTRFGFARLQDSVWVYPFPCEDIIELLRTSYRLRYDVLYLLSDRFPQDGWLAREFKLE